jgi:DNA-binding winged helix-turn-helix (wHTH) protein
MRIRFDCWTYDPGTRQLVRGDRATRLSPKGFELLGHLLERRPQACSKQELFERLWPGTFVSEATLASLVAELRRALRDNARKPRFLRTVHGFGYAFCGEAFGEPDAPSSAPDAACFRLRIGHREVGLRAGDNVLGRTRDAVVWVEGTTVSRRHARIVVRGESATLEDLGSKNGTFLRGTRVTEPVPLADGESFRLGDESLTLCRHSEAPTDTSDDTPDA